MTTTIAQDQTITVASMTTLNGAVFQLDSEIFNFGSVTNLSGGGTLVTESAAHTSNDAFRDFSDVIIETGGTSLNDIWWGGNGALEPNAVMENAILAPGFIANNGGTIVSLAAYGGSQVYLNAGTIETSTFSVSGDELEIYGGTAMGNTFSDGGEDLNFSGNEIGTQITSVGEGFVEGGSTTLVSVNGNAAFQSISSGFALDTSVANKGVQYLYGGSAIGTTINSGGNQRIYSGDAGGDIINTGGIVTQLGGTLGATTLDGGILDIQGGAQTGTININSGVLDVDESGPASFSVKMGVGGGEIEFPNFTIENTETVTTDNQGYVTIGVDVINFGLAGEQILLTQGAAVATVIATGTEIPCFVVGTPIAMIRGGKKEEITVELLSIGDVAVTGHGTQPIKWIGTRSYDGQFIADNHMMLPVCFKADSIADGVPCRDLYVSPGHGMCVDGMLIPAWRLINGVSISQAQNVESVSYFHIELERHDVLFAANCPAESFYDGAEKHRAAFHNAADFATLYPDKQKSGPMCLPRVEQGFALEAIRTRIATRAGIVTPARQPGTLRGFVDQAGDEGVVSGWAQDAAKPEMPVVLDVLLHGRRAARVIANQYRPDVRKAGFGSGCCGFELKLPLGMKGRVEIRQSVDLQPLPLATTPPRRPTVPGDIPSAGMAA